MAYVSLSIPEARELISKVVYGYDYFHFKDKTFCVRFPTAEETGDLYAVYNESLNKYTEGGLPYSEDLKETLIQSGAMPDGMDNMMNYYKKTMEENRKAMELSTDNKQRDEISEMINILSQKLGELHIIERRLLSNSAESKAEEDRVNFLVSRCSYVGSHLKSRIWEDYNSFLTSSNTSLFLSAKRAFLTWSMGLNAAAIRSLARSSEWRARWGTSKKTGTPIFSGAAAEWDINKASLCHWSDFYDSVLEYTTPPADDVLNDDDLLFRWLQDVKRLNKAKSSGAHSGQNSEVLSVQTPYKVRTKNSFEKVK